MTIKKRAVEEELPIVKQAGNDDEIIDVAQTMALHYFKKFKKPNEKSQLQIKATSPIEPEITLKAEVVAAPTISTPGEKRKRRVYKGRNLLAEIQKKRGPDFNLDDIL